VSVDPTPPPALKVLAYADDVCDFLPSSADFLRLQHHLHTYSQVSNAKVNLSKTEAVSQWKEFQPMVTTSCTAPDHQMT
jgi:hypothetical protein